MSSNPSFSTDARILFTRGDTVEGSPPVMLILLTQMCLSLNSWMTVINLGISKVEEVSLDPALQQKRQWALHPLVTLTNRFTEGMIFCPGSSMILHPCDLMAISLPKIFMYNGFRFCSAALVPSPYIIYVFALLIQRREMDPAYVFDEYWLLDGSYGYEIVVSDQLVVSLANLPHEDRHD